MSAETIPGMTAHRTAPCGFLLLHGWQNRRPVGHWQHWLAGRLTDLGHVVDYPQLPDPDDPDLDRWLEELARHLDDMEGTELVVICHSLAGLLWLHAAARPCAEIRVDRVLLVAPPSPSVAVSHVEIAGFAPPRVTPAQLAAVAGDTRLVAGDDDPYCPEGAADLYGRPLQLVTDIIAGGAHLNPDSGYGDWPSVLRWCLDPATPVIGRLETPMGRVV